MKRLLHILSLFVLATACTIPARAEEAGSLPTLVAQKLNPLASAVNLPVMLSFGFAHNQDAQPTLNFQPLIPFRLTDDWRVVTRSNASIIHLPDPQEVTGLGDTDVSLFFTPTRTGAWVWGAGPIVQFPTATDTTLGTGKWSAGPTAVLVYDDGPWVNGLLVSHLWSFAGPSSRTDVSLTQIEVQLSYAFSGGWYVQTNPTLSYDWKAPSGQGWTIPVGADVGRTFKVGAQGLSLQVGAYYNVKKPDGAADWVLQTQLTWLY